MSYDDLGPTVGASCSPKKHVLDLMSSTTSWSIIAFLTRLGAVDRNGFAARTVTRTAVTATSSTPHGSIRCVMICLCYKSDSGLKPGTLAHLCTNIAHHGSANRSVTSLTAVSQESDIGSCLFRDASEVAFPIQLAVHLYLLSTCSSLISVSGRIICHFRGTYHTKQWPPAPPAPPIPGWPWLPSAPPRPPRTSQDTARSRCRRFSSTYIVTLPPSPPVAPCEPRPALIAELEPH